MKIKKIITTKLPPNVKWILAKDGTVIWNSSYVQELEAMVNR